MRRSLRPDDAAGADHRADIYDDISDIVEESLVELAHRRAKYLGDDLAALELLASFIDAAVRALADRVGSARAHGCSWPDIASALSTSPMEARMHFDQTSRPGRAWLHDMS
jgi:hypothetical protein